MDPKLLLGGTAVLALAYLGLRKDAKKRTGTRDAHLGEREAGGRKRRSQVFCDQGLLVDDPEFDRIKADIERQAAGGFKTLEDARNKTFKITKAVLSDLCPDMRLPDSRSQMATFESDSDFLVKWDQVEALVWNAVTGISPSV